jgi:hypothetical protein
MESVDTGRTEQFTPVRVAGEPGAMLEAIIAGHDGHRLLAA